MLTIGELMILVLLGWKSGWLLVQLAARSLRGMPLE